MLDLKLFDRKTNMLILSSLREDLIGVTMFPAALNTRSDYVLVAQMHFKATVARYLASSFHHQASGSSLDSSHNSNWKRLEIRSARPFNT